MKTSVLYASVVPCLVCLAWLVCLVWLICLVCLVRLVCLVLSVLCVYQHAMLVDLCLLIYMVK